MMGKIDSATGITHTARVNPPVRYPQTSLSLAGGPEDIVKQRPQWEPARGITFSTMGWKLVYHNE